MWNKLLIIIALFTLILAGCQATAKDAWVEVIKKCATTQTIDEDKLLYFGPSNTIGPGSLWRKDTQGKGYGLRMANEDLSENKKIVHKDTPALCKGQSVTETKLGPKLSFTSELSPVSAEVKADFEKAKSISAKAAEIRWYTVQEKPFEDYIRAAEIKFDASIAAELEGKYSGTLPAELVGDLGAGISASWRDGTTLVLESKAPFFVVGELHPWLSGHLRRGKPGIVPRAEIIGKKEARVFRDSP
jgi:hypothetical protein